MNKLIAKLQPHKKYLLSLAWHNSLSMVFYIILSLISGTPIRLISLIMINVIGIILHKFFVYKETK